MSYSLLLNLSSTGALISPSSRAGHCLDEPGSLGWKLYQAERKQNLKELKVNKLNQERAEEEKRKVQEKVELWKANNQRFDQYDPNFDPALLPKIVEKPKKPSLISRKTYSRVPTAGSGRSFHVHFSENEILADSRNNGGFAPYVPTRIRTQLTSEIIAPGRTLPTTPEKSKLRSALKSKIDGKKNKCSRSRTSVTATGSSLRVQKSLSRPKIKKSNLDNASITARAGSVIGTSVKVKKSKSRSKPKKSTLDLAGASARPGTTAAIGTSVKVTSSSSGSKAKKLNLSDVAAGIATGTSRSGKVKNSKLKPTRNINSSTTNISSKPGTAAGAPRKSKTARRKKSSKQVGTEEQNVMVVAAGLAETQIGTGDLTAGIETLGTANSRRAPRFKFTPNTPLPGTPEWDRYWKGYHKALAKFDKDMNEFSAGLEDYDEILAGYKKEAKRITNEERLFKAGLVLLGSSVNFTPVTRPPPMRREPITEAPIAFNGYVISSRKVEGTISNQLGMVNGIVIQVNIGTTDPDTLEIERDNHFFTLSFGSKRHFLHICVPSGKSPTDVVMHPAIGGYVYIEGP